MPPQFDFSTGPDKVFVEATHVAFGPGRLVTNLRSGEEDHVFIFDIGHAKQYARLLTQNVEAYEKQYGEVDGRLPNEPMPTPFQYPENGDEASNEQ